LDVIVGCVVHRFLPGHDRIDDATKGSFLLFVVVRHVHLHLRTDDVLTNPAARNLVVRFDGLRGVVLQGEAQKSVYTSILPDEFRLGGAG